jgi:two-component system sensor histidine kinase KdpD
MRAWLERHGYLFAVSCIGVSTLMFYPGRDYFAKGQWALLYLPIIVLVASISGVRPALLAALLAFLAWNFFFLPPYHTFVIADPKDWLSLFVFLIVGVAMGLQTGRMRWRESEAIAREKEAILLNQFSSHLVAQTTASGMAQILIEEVAGFTGCQAAALYLPDPSAKLLCSWSSTGSAAELEPRTSQLATWVYEQAKAVGLPPVKGVTETGLEGWPISARPDEVPSGSLRRDIVLPLQSASRIEGVLYVGTRMDRTEYTVHDARLLVSIANQAAAFLERGRLQSIATQAEALREADRLKSAFVSSVSHELKTPLASVTAIITGLLEEDVEWDSVALRRELEAVAEDLGRLNDSISSLLDLSRLESDAWSPQKDWYEIGEILGSAVSKLPHKQRERINFSLPDDLPSIYVDFAQWARALQNLLENAFAYSDVAEPVLVGASADSEGIRVWVEDRGPGIPAEEKPKVFDKFYRGEAAAKAPSGTGLGLAITREIVRSHGGRIWVEDVEPHGARFVVVLPNTPTECKVE